MLPDIHRATQKFYIFLIVYLTGCTPNYIHFTQESVVGTYQWKVTLERMWGRTDK